MVRLGCKRESNGEKKGGFLRKMHIPSICLHVFRGCLGKCAAKKYEHLNRKVDFSFFALYSRKRVAGRARKMNKNELLNIEKGERVEPCRN